MDKAGEHQNKYNLLVGTYTNDCQSEGIYVYEFDTSSGEVKLKNKSQNIINPSYLSVSPDNKFIYTVNENGKDSTISSFDYSSGSGRLTLLSKSDSMGEDPCYLINDRTNVIAANYGSGSIAVFKKLPNGSISKAQQLIQHKGRGLNPSRQDHAHVHMVLFSPDHQFVLSNDLGTDKIYIYRYDRDSDSEILKLKQTINVMPGSGPRHAVFGSNGEILHVIHELDETLSTYLYNSKGSLELINQTNITPENTKKANSAAAIKISPDGSFLYVTDRGDANLISVYIILKNGNLELLEQVPTLGKNPRDFAIDLSGNYLLIAHQDSNTVTVFRRDKTTGKLSFIDKEVEICSPVCLLFTEIIK